MMQVGLLWLDDSPNVPFWQKLERAADYYKSKYGRVPNVCYVHPSCLPCRQAGLPESSQNGKITVRSAPDILPHHFWLGRKTQ